jgi:MarR family 2-MHQ and catechol resistance regulon transcriptional repressor
MKPFRRFDVDIYKSNIFESSIYGVACTFTLLEKVISDTLRPFKLTPAKFNAMMIIKHKGKDKGISQIEIGRHLIVTASNMTRLIDKLDREGYIERLNLLGDRRVNLVKISKKGSELLDQIWPDYYKKANTLARLLSHAELKRLTHILERWSGKISEHNFDKRV